MFFSYSPTAARKKKEKTQKKSANKKSATHISYFNELFRQNTLPDAISELFSVLRIVADKADKILCRSTMSRFSLQITAFHADAAAAAIQYGEICAAVYPFLGFLNSKISFKRQKVEIFCDYTCGKSSFQMDLKWRLVPLLCIGPLIALLFDLIKNKGR
ncbi:MAG: hypothetical protein IJW78_01495 [Clostridia bacterium]|nr:hypothetical protein [Clostridia bacterium]